MTTTDRLPHETSARRALRHLTRALVATWLAISFVPGCGRAPSSPPGDSAATEAGRDSTHATAELSVALDAAPPERRPREAGHAHDSGTHDSGAYTGIPCGFGICTAGSDFCCVAGTSQQCYPKNTVGPKCDFGATCDGAEDCGSGESCCMPSGAVNQTYCIKGTCPAGRALCHRQADCAAAELCCLSLESGWEHSECMAMTACPS
jgi:hypothetical protein